MKECLATNDKGLIEYLAQNGIYYNIPVFDDIIFGDKCIRFYNLDCELEEALAQWKIRKQLYSDKNCGDLCGDKVVLFD